MTKVQKLAIVRAVLETLERNMKIALEQGLVFSINGPLPFKAIKVDDLASIHASAANNLGDVIAEFIETGAL